MTTRNISKPTHFPTGVIATNNGVTSGSIVSANFANYIQNGSNNPDYKVKIAKHQDASTAYTLKKYDIYRLLQFGDVIDNSKLRYSFRGYPGGFPSPISTIPSRPIADDIALKRIKGKLSNDLQQFKALIPLGELKETRRLLNQVVFSTTGLVKSLIDLKHGKVRNVLRKASDAWLTFSFGVSPTISDINGLVNSIGSYLYQPSEITRYTGSFEEIWSSGSIAINLYSPCTGMILEQRDLPIFHHYKVNYTCGVLLRPQSANPYSIDEHFGLTFGDLPSLFWELTPFSWIGDYFGTMGAYLEDLFFQVPGNTIYLTKSVLYKARQAQVFLPRPSNSLYTLIGGNSSSTQNTIETTLFNRSLLSSLPHRSFRFKTADEIGVNSVKRLLNLSSLLLR